MLPSNMELYQSDRNYIETRCNENIDMREQSYILNDIPNIDMNLTDMLRVNVDKMIYF